jgi:hypothetical protein
MTEGIHRLREFIGLHKNILWWLHSAYALLLGLVFMWLGARHFAYLRILTFYIAFIWLTSLLLPLVTDHAGFPRQWRGRARLVINYFHRNFYQQLLFFVLPIYYASATWGSRNLFFIALLAMSAVLSTLDVVYDRYVSEHRPLAALFFAFNIFACVNLMLPVLWSVSNYWALWISAALAVVGFASVLFSVGRRAAAPSRVLLCAAAAGLCFLVLFLRSFVPPAPLRLVSAEFGRSISGLKIQDPLRSLPGVWPDTVVGMTAIRAPLGLKEMVQHRWYIDDKLIYASPFYILTGGRSEGYRIWTHVRAAGRPGGEELVLDVATRGGQLIGRARLRRQPEASALGAKGSAPTLPRRKRL